MLIDCDTCSVRGLACSDCVVSVLLTAAPHDRADEALELDAAERSAIAALAGSGLVPPLRLASSSERPAGRRARGQGRPAERPDGHKEVG